MSLDCQRTAQKWNNPSLTSFLDNWWCQRLAHWLNITFHVYQNVTQWHVCTLQGYKVSQEEQRFDRLLTSSTSLRLNKQVLLFLLQCFSILSSHACLHKSVKCQAELSQQYAQKRTKLSRLQNQPQPPNTWPAAVCVGVCVCVFESECSPGCLKGAVIKSFQQIVWQSGGFPASLGILRALLHEAAAEHRVRLEEFCLARL